MTVSSSADPRIVAVSLSRATKLPSPRLRGHPSRPLSEAPGPGSQETSKPAGKRSDIPDFTLPNDENLPAHHFEGLRDAFIASDVTEKLCPPKTRARLGHGTLATPSMLMPEAAVHENDLPTRRKCEVRDTRKIATVQSKSVPERVYQLANQDFGLGIFAADGRHEAATLR
jgi:hypothetical protein